MGWMNTCNSAAGKRYQRRVLITMAIYLITLFACIRVVHTFHPAGWALYALSILPAVPIIVVLGVMGMYLQEEKDEFLRMLTVRSLMVAAASMLSVVVVSDFLRAIAERGPVPPFVLFMVFFLTFGAAQGVQQLQARGGGDE